MNIKELNIKLNELGVKEDAYCLYGNPVYESYCIQKFNEGWLVYHFERGEKYNKQFFEQESKACKYFLKELKSDSSVFI